MPKQILIVENSEAYRSLLQDIVAGMGLGSLAVDSATKAVEALSGEAFDLVLLDIKMPNIHGDLFLRYIRRKGNRVPVIVISGYLTPDVLQSVQRHAVHDVVAKPFKVQRVTQAIAEVLGGD